MAYPTLSNAPIEEAVISLTIGQQKHASIEEVEKICTTLKPTYPQRKEWKIQQVSFQIKDSSVNTSHQDKHKGFALSSNDQKSILSLSQDTLSFNRLRPYGSWDKFSADYKSAWEVFTKPLDLKEISKLTIRYINSFTIPINNWEKYLLMRPNLHSENTLDHSVISMREAFSRYILSSDKHVAESAVLLTLQPEGDFLKIIMDIEVRSKNSITNYPGYHAITDVLNRLRDFKNQIFFSNLPKAEELFS